MNQKVEGVKFERIRKRHEFTFEAALSGQTLFLYLKLHRPNPIGCVYIGEVHPESINEKLHKICKTLEDILLYCKKVGTVRINIQKQSVGLLDKNFSQIIVFPLKKFKRQQSESESWQQLFPLQLYSINWVGNYFGVHAYEHFQLSQNRIQAIKGNTKIFSSYRCQGKFRFIIKVINLSCVIYVGLSDLQRFENHETYSFNRFNGIHSGDYITVLGNLDEGVIEFQVNYVTVSSYQKSRLQDLSIKWFPFIELTQPSCVSIIESFPSSPLLLAHMAEKWFVWDDDLLYELNEITSFTHQEKEKEKQEEKITL